MTLCHYCHRPLDHDGDCGHCREVPLVNEPIRKPWTDELPLHEARLRCIAHLPVKGPPLTGAQRYEALLIERGEQGGLF